MFKTAIVTDTTASIPDNISKDLNIHQVAYYIHRGVDVLRDLVTVKRKEFLDWLPTAKELPKTASPGPGDYLTTYEKLAKQGTKQIISIHMTSKGSGAFQAAKAAQGMLAEKLPDLKIEVIDTLNVSLCQGWMAIEAARQALDDVSFETIINNIKEMIPITHMIQTADTLKYLYLGGRIGKAVHLVGSMLSLKPLIGMEKGEIIALGVARGLNKAYQKMVDNIETVVGKKGKIKVAFVHAGAFEQLQNLKELVEDRFECVESFIAELSPALMVHTGPGTTGLCYYPVKK